MLTSLTVHNFKRFREVKVELGSPVLFIGPNNSGKTSALQALALWEIGLRRWNEKRKGKKTPERRPGVTINRRDLIAVPVPNANLLWRDLHVRDVSTAGEKPETRNVRIDILVEGIGYNGAWECGLEFDYANEESFYCRPLRISDEKNPQRMPIPDPAVDVRVAYLPPMSGLAARETRLDPGATNVRIGEGRTAEVLRNLCYQISTHKPERWADLTARIERLFGATLEEPRYVVERGEIEMSYSERSVALDLSSSGRGLQQTLLLVSYMYANPGAVLLLDEPDAHLEILRQRQIYQILTEVARDNNNQIIAATHSEVLLNEAADRDVVVAFVGAPHRIDDRGSQVVKALRDIGFEDYYLAEQAGWVLYVEGATDLALLRSFAELLDHQQARMALERPFVRYVGNQPGEVVKHFFGLREAVRHLRAVAVFDRLLREPPPELLGIAHVWKRREVENYVCYPETLEAYAEATAREEAAAGPIFEEAEVRRRVGAMRSSVREVAEALETLGKGSPWSADLRVSEEFLVPLFEKYYRRLGLPNVMAKKNFHELARYVPAAKLDPEVREKLDAIAEAALLAGAGDQAV
jgi:ABC-type branched-subunit amino acid transport system ATPase component